MNLNDRCLQALWPRLQKYAVRSPADPLWAPCAAGAAGDPAQAAACFQGWDTVRVPALLATVDQIRDRVGILGLGFAHFWPVSQLHAIPHMPRDLLC